MTASVSSIDHWAQTKDKVTILSQLLLNEQQLIGHRMAWLVMSQSFLFGAVIFGDAPHAGETWAGNAPAIVLPAWFAGSWLVLTRTVWNVAILQSATLIAALGVVALVIRGSVQLIYRPKPQA